MLWYVSLQFRNEMSGEWQLKPNHIWKLRIASKPKQWCFQMRWKHIFWSNHAILAPVFGSRLAHDSCLTYSYPNTLHLMCKAAPGKLTSKFTWRKKSNMLVMWCKRIKCVRLNPKSPTKLSLTITYVSPLILFAWRSEWKWVSKFRLETPMNCLLK